MMSNISSKPAVRLLLMVVGIAICVWTIRAATLFGMSHMFVKYAQATGNLEASQRATEMTPLDADSYRTRAALTVGRAPAEAVADIEHAIALRPADYTLWLELGLARDQNADPTGALTAFNEAIRRAPFYAMPYWQRGNLLLRLGQYDAAFTDLNHAVESNPDLIYAFIDLAWSVTKGDANATQQLVRVNTKGVHTYLARFLASKGKAEQALQQLQAAGTVTDDIRHEVIENLLVTENFAEAHRVWSATRSDAGTQAPAGIVDGGFESSLSFNEGGFSWRIPQKQQAVSVSLDSTEPHSGAKNLRIEFGGDSPPNTSLASQFLMVEPSHHYQVNFAARSQEIVSGGLPIVEINDAAAGNKLLGKSAPLSKGTTGWSVFSFDFTTGPNTHAVILGVRRENCTGSPCPIFGVLSLDSFSLAQLK